MFGVDIEPRANAAESAETGHFQICAPNSLEQRFVNIFAIFCNQELQLTIRHDCRIGYEPLMHNLESHTALSAILSLSLLL